MFSVCFVRRLWASRAFSVGLRNCGLLQRPWYTEYTPGLLLAKKQLFLDHGLVHSGVHGQDREESAFKANLQIEL